jgi:hypothetical protein
MDAPKISVSEYILMVDQDDWIEPVMLEELYIKMISGNYDMVCCDYYDEYYEERAYRKQNFESKSNNELMEEIITWGEFLPCTWNKLIKTEIYKKVEFPETTYSEDRAIMTQVVYYRKKIGYVNKGLYHWRHISIK